MNLRNQHRLIFVVGQHVDVSTVGNGEDVGRYFRATLASVQLSTTEGVHGEPLVRVDGHAEETGVRLLMDRTLVDSRRCDEGKIEIRSLNVGENFTTNIGSLKGEIGRKLDLTNLYNLCLTILTAD